MAAAKEKELKFDQARLQNMTEPLSVRVEKIRGNVRQPIELPAKGDEQTGFFPPGTNWTRNDVLQLENFILTKWSGGGYYEFAVTDAKGEVMRWQGVWDPRMYPEKVPPNTAEAALVNVATNPQQIAGPALIPSSAQPLGATPGNLLTLGINYNNPPHTGPIMPPVAPPGTSLPPPAPSAPAPTAPAAPQMQAPNWNGWPGWNATPGWGGAAWGSPMPGWHVPRGRLNDDEDDRDRRRRVRLFEDDSEKRELEKKLQQLEIERKEMEYKQALERQQQAHEQQMNALREELRRLAEGGNRKEDEEVRRMREERDRERERMQEQQLLQMRQQHEQAMAALREEIARIAASRNENEAIARLREEQERQRQEFERQRLEDQRRLEAERAERERERERFERERRDEMLQRELKEAREAAERRFEQLAVQNRTNDPIIEMVKETTRQNAEQMREIARMQNEATNRITQFMVSPLQVAQLVKESANGADGMLRGIVDTVGQIGSLYKNAAETIMQMSGGGGDPPAARLIQEGIGRASEVAERFLAVKRDQVISEAKVKQAEAARDQTRIQAEVALRAQQMAAATGRPISPQWAPPPVVAPSPTPAPAPAPTANGLNGTGLNGAGPVQVQTQPTQAQAQRPAVAIATSNTPATNGESALQVVSSPPLSASKVEVKSGPSEEEMFGVALESVQRLRRGVADGKLDPDKTIDAILQGVDYVVNNGLVIPAFVLFQQERWADFIDIMLPAAPQEFKNECVRILTEEIEASVSTEDDEDDEDSKDDEDGKAKS
jgi:hypothetical protein